MYIWFNGKYLFAKVAKPNIGENRPSRVRADVTIDLNLRREIKAEWESIRKHDVIFLVCCRPAKVTAASLDPNQLFKEKVEIYSRCFQFIIYIHGDFS